MDHINYKLNTPWTRNTIQWSDNCSVIIIYHMMAATLWFSNQYLLKDHLLVIFWCIICDGLVFELVCPGMSSDVFWYTTGYANHVYCIRLCESPAVFYSIILCVLVSPTGRQHQFSSLSDDIMAVASLFSDSIFIAWIEHIKLVIIAKLLTNIQLQYYSGCFHRDMERLPSDWSAICFSQQCL